MATDTLDDHTSVAATAAVTPVAIVVSCGERVVRAVHPVGAAEVVIGRVGGDAGLGVDDERVSRRHAVVRWSAGAWVVRDLGSRNGTQVGGERLEGERRLAGDGVVRIGQSVIVLVRDGRGHTDPVVDDAEAVIGPELARAHDQIARAAAGAALLVVGETGTGKEAAARRYHQHGPRADGPLVAVNCATIPEGLAERLLFGSRRGAFSGATDADGYLRAADRGTLFLDEIGELDPIVQAKLLRVLETRDVVPLGASTGRTVELGIVAATHRDLEAEVAAGRFRADLYYRLAHPLVALPPLRARVADVPRLIARVLAHRAAGLRPHPRLIEAACLRAWPGNIRELVHAVDAAAVAAVTAGREVVRADDLPAVAAAAAVAPPSATAEPAAEPASVGRRRRPDRAAIEDALRIAAGNVAAAARALGLHRTQLYRRMERLGISAPRDDAD